MRKISRRCENALMEHQEEVLNILQEAKLLERRYRVLTGKPLGVTGEVAEFEAARILDLDLTPARQAGHDAIEVRGGGQIRLQIKGRCLPLNAKRGQRIGSISLNPEWDSLLMVILDEDLDAVAIYEAPRDKILGLLDTPGSKARNQRRSLAVSQVERVSILRWERESQATAAW